MEKLTEEQIAKLVDFVKRLSMPESDEEQIQNEYEYTVERSRGNCDDCFCDGRTQADAYTAIMARAILEELGIK